MPILRNLVFDLGGVLYAIDPSRTEARLRAWATALHGIPAQTAELFLDLEAGQIGPEAFRERLRAELGHPVTDAELDAAWNALLLGVIPGRIQDLQDLGRDYRLILLSNTNIIHQDCIRAECAALFACFERIFFSYELGCRKPDPRIYRMALEASGMEPGESMFIDDGLANVEGAQSIGMQGFHLSNQPGGTWEDLMRLLQTKMPL